MDSKIGSNQFTNISLPNTPLSTTSKMQQNATPTDNQGGKLLHNWDQLSPAAKQYYLQQVKKMDTPTCTPVAPRSAPIVSTPTLAASKPAPITPKPAPVASNPTPMASNPTPVASNPTLATPKPAPITPKPAPIVSTSTPIVSNPVPSSTFHSFPASSSQYQHVTTLPPIHRQLQLTRPVQSLGSYPRTLQGYGNIGLTGLRSGPTLSAVPASVAFRGMPVVHRNPIPPVILPEKPDDKVLEFFSNDSASDDESSKEENVGVDEEIDIESIEDDLFMISDDDDDAQVTCEIPSRCPQPEESGVLGKLKRLKKKKTVEITDDPFGFEREKKSSNKKNAKRKGRGGVPLPAAYYADIESEEGEAMVTSTRATRRKNNNRTSGEAPKKRTFCINIPVSVFGNGKERTFGQLAKSLKGRPYLMLAGLVGQTCYQMALPPEEKKKGKGKKRNNHDDDGDDGVFCSLEEEEENQLNSKSEQAKKMGKFYWEPTDRIYSHTSHQMESIRSNTGVLLWVRLIFHINNPDVNFRDEIMKVIQHNMEQKQKEDQKASATRASARFDNPNDWRCYRSISSVNSYFKLLTEYTGINLDCSSTIDTAIPRTHDPVYLFSMMNKGSLTFGISGVESSVAITKYTKVDTYFLGDKYIRKSDFGIIDGGVDVVKPSSLSSRKIPRQMDRQKLKQHYSGTCFTPDSLVEDDTENSAVEEYERQLADIVSKGNDADDDDEIRKLAAQLGELRMTTGASEDIGEKYQMNYDKGIRTDWDTSENNESDFEVTNPAVRMRKDNMETKRAIIKQYETGTQEYMDEMQAFKRVATARLNERIQNITNEPSEWDNVFVLGAKWFEEVNQTPEDMWPRCNRSTPQLSAFGNAMLQEVQTLIHSFDLEPGWKPRELQKYLTVQLDVYCFRFDIHLCSLLSGGASVGKSKLIQSMLAMRISDTILSSTSMTPRTLVTNGSWFNHKTLAFEEAPPWMLGMNDDGSTLKGENNIWKDVLSRAASLGLRNHWDSEKGQSNVAISRAILMINVLMGSNMGYPSKDSPTIKRLLVDDVILDKCNPYSVRDIAFRLESSKDEEFNTTVCKQYQLTQYLHMIAELYISSCCMSDVNVDIPIMYMKGIFEYLRNKYKIPLPDIRTIGMLLKACRVLTIQHAIRICYFSEIGQARHQCLSKKVKVADDGLGKGKETQAAEKEEFIFDEEGNPVYKPFIIDNFREEIEPFLYCTEDVFIYALTMLEAHLIPRTDAVVFSIIATMCYEKMPEIKLLHNKNFNGTWYKIYDPHYYELVYPNEKKFYREVSQRSGNRINQTTVETIIFQLNERTMKMRQLPRLRKRNEDDSPYEVMDTELECGRMKIGDMKKREEEIKKYTEYDDDDDEEGRGKEKNRFVKNPNKMFKMKSMHPIRFEKQKDGNNIKVCICRDLVEHEIPATSPTIVASTGQVVRGIIRDFSYKSAMKEAIEKTMSHYGTRERKVLISSELNYTGKKYPGLLDYVYLKRDPENIIIKDNHIRKDAVKDILVHGSVGFNNKKLGASVPFFVVDDDLEDIVARIHAKKIGMEFKNVVLPAFQDEMIKLLRELLPKLFKSPSEEYGFDTNDVEYPDTLCMLRNYSYIEKDFYQNTIKKAAKTGQLKSVLDDPRFSRFRMSNIEDTTKDFNEKNAGRESFISKDDMKDNIIAGFSDHQKFITESSSRINNEFGEDGAAGDYEIDLETPEGLSRMRSIKGNAALYKEEVETSIRDYATSNTLPLNNFALDVSNHKETTSSTAADADSETKGKYNKQEKEKCSAKKTSSFLECTEIYSMMRKVQSKTKKLIENKKSKKITEDKRPEHLTQEQDEGPSNSDEIEHMADDVLINKMNKMNLEQRERKRNERDEEIIKGSDSSSSFGVNIDAAVSKARHKMNALATPPSDILLQGAENASDVPDHNQTKKNAKDIMKDTVIAVDDDDMFRL